MTSSRSSRPGFGYLLGLLLAALLAGCATPPQTRQLAEAHPDIPDRALLTDVPFFPQDAYQCGPAALAMVLRHDGVDVTSEQLVPRIYVPDREGSFQVEILAATRHHNRLALEIEPRLDALLRWIDAGKPVLVFQNLGLDWYPKWHYAVAIGYDLETMEIVLHSGRTANYRLPLSVFERTWRRSAHWGMTALVPGEIPPPATATAYLRAAASLEETRPDAELDKVWLAGMKAWPERPEFRMGLANHFYARNRPADAEKLYRQILDRHPEYLPAYNNLATLLTEQGEPEEAIAIASEGLEKAGTEHPFLEQTLNTARQRVNSP